MHGILFVLRIVLIVNVVTVVVVVVVLTLCIALKSVPNVTFKSIEDPPNFISQRVVSDLETLPYSSIEAQERNKQNKIRRCTFAKKTRIACVGSIVLVFAIQRL